MQQRSQLVKYTANTGCIRPYNYTVTAEEKATCTPYTQSILTFIEEGAKVAPNLAIATKRRLYTGRNRLQRKQQRFRVCGEGRERDGERAVHLLLQPAG